ncbi:MAG: non-canonical purine NTP pyrophosphatase [Acidobacteria bacterium]|nr:non-canonical purine NTP pyrophosphatase [Acidobacteriota bacterium]
MKLLVATTNRSKIGEIVPLLHSLDLEIVTLADIPPIVSPEETATTFWENARIKAFAYAAASGLMTVAEDSGIEIAALDGAPGVHSARFLGIDVPYPQRFREIGRRLDADTNATRDARFVVAISVVRHGELLFETEAAVDGTVASEPCGDGGFGYDPLFFYPPLGMTLAACTPLEKAAISHRGRAFRDLARWLAGASRA